MLARLRHEMQTNKPLRLIGDTDIDVEAWNAEVAAMDGRGWYEVSWLLAECYMYRRVREALLMASMGEYDPFRTQKEAAYRASQASIRNIATYATTITGPDTLGTLLLVGLIESR